MIKEKNGAGDETRTHDSHLGKVMLYQLSYTRKPTIFNPTPSSTILLANIR